MAAIATVLNQGLQHHQAGNWQQAEQCYQQVLTEEPQHPDALHLLGVLAHQQGDGERAIAILSQAVEISPQQPIYWNSLGEAYRAQGQLNQAVTCYTEALGFEFQYPEAHFNLANTLQRLGQTQAAIASYQQVIALKPEMAPAHHNLGVLLKQQGDFAAATVCYRQALALQPNYALAWNSLGVVLSDTGAISEAIAALEKALALDPNLAEAHLNLGNLLKSQPSLDGKSNLPDSLQQALDRYQQALTLKPDWAEAYFTLGNFYKDQGQTALAQEHYQKALELQPDYPEAFWNQQLILPILYDHPDEIHQWRSQFSQGLNRLIAAVSLQTRADQERALAGLSSVTNFYLQYQGLSDCDLQRQYGQLVQRVMQANYPQWSRPIQRHVGQRKIRVGFVSHFWREHTVAKLFLGWVEGLDRQAFQIYGYHLGQQQDAWTTRFQQACDVQRAVFDHRFYGSPNQFEATCGQIYQDRLDVLVFPDIGMNADSYKLAGLRLAPVQCVAWGHPITSGIPTVDYFLSSAAMEPEQAQAEYTETLIQLPKIGISYTPSPLPEAPPHRADWGLPEGRVLYLSCQSLYKYLPQYDALLPQIAQHVPQAAFVFLASPTKGDFVTQRFQTRLERAFATQGLDSQNYCYFLPRLDLQAYLQVNRCADIFLDTCGWSGGNTTLEAIACGLPVVTYPGDFMRGRHAAAMLQVLEVPETIAKSESDYVDIAVRLGRDKEYRVAIATRMQAQLGNLFGDQTCVRALEAFFKRIARES